MSRRLGVGIDLGASRLRVCLGDSEGNLTWRDSKEMSFPSEVEGYVQQVVDAAKEATKRAHDPSEVAGIGLASTGPLDLLRGGMSRPANVPYEFVPLVAPVSEALSLKVALINDANAGVLGERSFGAGKGEQNLVYITISSGIGGGAVVDGHLLIGKDGNAAEVGHFVVDPSERLVCGCGRRGHWEAYCSGRNIPLFAKLIALEEERGSEEVSVESLLGVKGRQADSAAIYSAASHGNGFASAVVTAVGKLNALGVANVVNMFDPTLITIGGGVALSNPELVIRPIRELLPKYTVNRVPEVMPTPLGDDACMLGALSLAFTG